jgi:hypothetical protein
VVSTGATGVSLATGVVSATGASVVEQSLQTLTTDEVAGLTTVQPE